MRSLTAAVLIFGLSLAIVASEREPLQEYRARRERLANATEGSIVVLYAAPDPELVEYQQEDNFYYLTGSNEPDAMLVLDATSSPRQEYLFLPPRDLAEERWTGVKLGPGADAEKLTGLQHVLATSDFEAAVRKAAGNSKTVYALRADFNKIRMLAPAANLDDAAPLIARFRQVKSFTEIARLERAIQITMKAQEAAARTIGPGVMEYEVEAAIEYEFRKNGAERPGFPSIVGSGPFSTILHYNENTRKMETGDLVVVDIGAEYGGYTADVTRTYPVSGKFSPKQREIYQIVLDAQEAAIRAVKPGTAIGRTGLHKVASDYIKAKGYAEYFTHGTSHHIGLEVHDVGDTARLLEPNMVITVEPGIYIPEEKLGVRIEDDVLVTASGYRVLSTFPKKSDEIEALMQKGK